MFSEPAFPMQNMLFSSTTYMPFLDRKGAKDKTVKWRSFNRHGLVCLIDFCVLKSFRCVSLGAKVKSHHTTFRGKVEYTSLLTSIETTIVFDLVVTRGYSAFFQ